MLGADRKQMERMLKQLGVKIRELEDVEEVILKLRDREIVVSQPSVTVTELRGQKIYQISGREEERIRICEEDVRLVMEQAEVGREDAERALREAGGDLAEAILRLREARSDERQGEPADR